MSGISTLSRPYKSITHLERSFLLPLAPPREPTSRSLFFSPLIPFFNAGNSCEFSTNSRKEAWPLFSNGNLIVSQLFNVARNSNRSSINFQRFFLPRNHRCPVGSNDCYRLVPCIQPSLFSCLFSTVQYIHTLILVAPEGIYAVAPQFGSQSAEFSTLFYLPTYTNLFQRSR